MKKKRYLVLLLLMALFIGCSSNKGTGEKTKEDTMKVYVSNYPLYDFTKNIAGDKVEVINVRQNAGVHGWEPSARDIANLKEADLFIYGGEHLEGWAEQLINDGTITNNAVDISEGLVLLESTHHHDHDEEHDHDHDEEHDHDHDDDHDHDHGQYDPHIWLSLRNAQVIVENISKALSELDQENKDFYQENYNKYANELKKLDEEYTEKLSNPKLEAIIVSHEAYGYLCRDYNFRQVGIEGVLAEGEPSVVQIDNIIKTSKELGVKTIFYEDTISPKVANLIASEVGANLELLSPIEILSPEQEDSGDDYLSIMKSNLEKIYKALNE